MLGVLVFFVFLGFVYGGSYAKCFYLVEKYLDIPAELLIAIAKVESGFNPKAVNRNRNGTYDIGLMQVNTSNLSLLKKKGIIRDLRDLFDPCRNVIAGGYILRLCIDRYGFNWKAVDCYNKGRRAKGRGRYVMRVYRELLKVLGR